MKRIATVILATWGLFWLLAVGMWPRMSANALLNLPIGAVIGYPGQYQVTVTAKIKTPDPNSGVVIFEDQAGNAFAFTIGNPY